MRGMPRVGVEPGGSIAGPSCDAGFERGPSRARLRELLRYSKTTGDFHWRTPRSGCRVGAAAGTTSKSTGYRLIRIDGVQLRAHRLAWLYVKGKWPEGDIDHWNTIRDDNRFDNLRDVAPLLNQQNRRQALRRNRTGLLGVSRIKDTGRFKANIHHNGKDIYLGCFDEPEAAHASYVAAKRQLHAGCTL